MSDRSPIHFEAEFHQAMLESLAAAELQSDQELVEFQQKCRQSDGQKLNALPWFLTRENAHEKVRVA